MANVHERWAEFKGQFKAWLAEGAKDLHNHVVPAFPTQTQGVDQPGTPLSMPSEAEAGGKPSFEMSFQRSNPAPAPQPAPVADQGMEL